VRSFKKSARVFFEGDARCFIEQRAWI